MLRLIHQISANFSYNIRSPFDLKYLRQPQLLPILKKSIESRFRDVSVADQTVAMLDKYRTALYQLQGINKKFNQLQKQMKDIRKNKNTTANADTATTEQLLKLISQQKQHQKQKQSQVKQLISTIQQHILKIGNIVHSIAPVSKDQSQNIILRKYQPSNGLLKHNKSYSDICQLFGLTDLKRGQKVGGHRGYFLKNQAVSMALGLAQYGIHFLQNKGYQLYYSPAIISEGILKGSCQLQSIEQDTYKLQGMDSYLIATSQQSLAGLFKDEVLSKDKIPTRMCGYSTCFRKQAGAHGKDIHGLFRVHQFEKVEQFTIVQPEKSQQEMERMIQISQQFYKSLQIPYRVVNIVSGELNDAASCKYDLQGWYPSQNRYRQLVSVSNCTEYQSRLLKTQYNTSTNQARYPHMLNGTLVAIQRAITCIIENNYHEDHIRIPKVLQEYMKVDSIKLQKNKNKNS